MYSWSEKFLEQSSGMQWYSSSPKKRKSMGRGSYRTINRSPSRTILENVLFIVVPFDKVKIRERKLTRIGTVRAIKDNREREGMYIAASERRLCRWLWISRFANASVNSLGGSDEPSSIRTLVRSGCARRAGKISMHCLESREVALNFDRRSSKVRLKIVRRYCVSDDRESNAINIC